MHDYERKSTLSVLVQSTSRETVPADARVTTGPVISQCGGVRLARDHGPGPASTLRTVGALPPVSTSDQRFRSHPLPQPQPETQANIACRDHSICDLILAQADTAKDTELLVSRVPARSLGRVGSLVGRETGPGLVGAGRAARWWCAGGYRSQSTRRHRRGGGCVAALLDLAGRAGVRCAVDGRGRRRASGPAKHHPRRPR